MPVPVFFFNDTQTTEIYTLSLHDALPICPGARRAGTLGVDHDGRVRRGRRHDSHARARSEEHTSELQSRFDLVCRLLLEKKKFDGSRPKLQLISEIVCGLL